MAKHVLDDARVLTMARIAIQIEGSQKAFARKVGMSEQYLSDILNGRRALSGAVMLLDWLGLEPVVSYRRKDGGRL